MDAVVIGGFEPFNEGGVEAVAHGGVDEDGAEADADGGEFLGGVVGAVVHIDGLGHAAFVEGGLEGVDEAGGVVGRVKGRGGRRGRRRR